jgi:hypothetical protein
MREGEDSWEDGGCGLSGCIYMGPKADMMVMRRI